MTESIVPEERLGSISLRTEERARYSRHLIMPEVTMTGQKRLKAARVLCIGAGRTSVRRRRFTRCRRCRTGRAHGRRMRRSLEFAAPTSCTARTTSAGQKTRIGPRPIARTNPTWRWNYIRSAFHERERDELVNRGL